MAIEQLQLVREASVDLLRNIRPARPRTELLRAEPPGYVTTDDRVTGVVTEVGGVGVPTASVLHKNAASRAGALQLAKNWTALVDPVVWPPRVSWILVPAWVR